MSDEKQAPAVLPLHIDAQLVEACLHADGRRVFRYRVLTGEGRRPVIAEHVLEAGVFEAIAVEADSAEQAAALVVRGVRETVERVVLEMAARGVDHSERDTLRDLDTCPRIGHAERARILEELIAKRGPEMTRKIGADWIRVMIESELRAVYADGEQKGAALARQTAG